MVQKRVIEAVESLRNERPLKPGVRHFGMFFGSIFDSNEQLCTTRQRDMFSLSASMEDALRTEHAFSPCSLGKAGAVTVRTRWTGIIGENAARQTDIVSFRSVPVGEGIWNEGVVIGGQDAHADLWTPAGKVEDLASLGKLINITNAVLKAAGVEGYPGFTDWAKLSQE